MAANFDFGYFSDTDDSAVEDLISQAQELSVLEQVSAINCSAFTDSVLPSELEQRFRKLKSFPPSKAKGSLCNDNENDNYCLEKKALQHSKSELCEHNPDGNLGLEIEFLQHSGDYSTEYEIFSESKQTPDRKMSLKENSEPGSVSASKSKSTSKSKLKSFFSPLSSPNSSMGSPSPPRKTGCFWCSPKGSSKKKSKENRMVGSGLDWVKNDEFLSDLSTFSVKEQQKMLKKAMEEEEKVNREAEKIVKLAKQASMRLNVHDSEDELGD